MKNMTGPSPIHPHAIRLLTIVLAISLLLHVVTIGALAYVRSTLHFQAQALADELEIAQQDVIALTVPVKLPVPIQTEIPIRTTINVPIDTTIPLDTTFLIPLNTPFGTYDVPVPIKGEVPVQITTPVTIDETVMVSTTMQIETTLPVELPVRDTFLGEYLSRLRTGLLGLFE